MSNGSNIVLLALETPLSGKYSCEVSADAPSFHTSIVSAEMEVVGECKAKKENESKIRLSAISHYFIAGQKSLQVFVHFSRQELSYRSFETGTQFSKETELGTTEY